MKKQPEHKIVVLLNKQSKSILLFKVDVDEKYTSRLENSNLYPLSYLLQVEVDEQTDH